VQSAVAQPCGSAPPRAGAHAYPLPQVKPVVHGAGVQWPFVLHCSPAAHDVGVQRGTQDEPGVLLHTHGPVAATGTQTPAEEAQSASLAHCWGGGGKQAPQPPVR
jgi:hypothetical protein